MRCPKCNNHVLQKSGDRIKLRVQGAITFQDDACITRCFWCKAEIAIPIKLQTTEPIASEKFYLSGKP